MTTAAVELLRDLRRRGARVWVEGGRVRYQAPRAAMDPETIDRLRASRVELLALLGTPCRCLVCAASGTPSHDPGCMCLVCDPAKGAPPIAETDGAREAAEDAALLTAIARAKALDRRASWAPGACPACRRDDHWQSRYGARFCRTCHPPAPGVEVPHA